VRVAAVGVEAPAVEEEGVAGKVSETEMGTEMGMETAKVPGSGLAPVPG
jgi:hypothetical protein